MSSLATLIVKIKSRKISKTASNKSRKISRQFWWPLTLRIPQVVCWGDSGPSHSPVFLITITTVYSRISWRYPRKSSTSPRITCPWSGRIPSTATPATTAWSESTKIMLVRGALALQSCRRTTLPLAWENVKTRSTRRFRWRTWTSTLRQKRLWIEDVNFGWSSKTEQKCSLKWSTPSQLARISSLATVTKQLLKLLPQLRKGRRRSSLPRKSSSLIKRGPFRVEASSNREKVESLPLKKLMPQIRRK